MDSKEKMIFLIDEYSRGNYKTSEFCDLFSDVYNHEYISDGTCVNLEELLQKICYLAERYSPYQTDLTQCNGYFINEEEFRYRFELLKMEVDLLL